MPKFRHTFPVVIALSVACLAAVDSPSRRRTQPPQVTAPTAVVFEKVIEGLPGMPEKPTPLFNVLPSTKMIGDQLAFHKMLAARLSQIEFIPDHRQKHFRWIVEDGRFRIKGWYARIEETAAIPGGILVKLRVGPVVESDIAPHTMIGDHSFETYRVMEDGSVSFVEAVTPPGTSTPGFYCL